MKKTLFAITLIATLFFTACKEQQVTGWIRINQLGYLPVSQKTAVFLVKDTVDIRKFALKDSATGKTVKKYDVTENFGTWEQFGNAVRLNFTDFETPGTYYIEANGVKSPYFRINKNVYDGTADFLLNYLRQQRCGWNPYIQDSCHVDDGFIVSSNKKLDGKHVDVVGGWHDATDYLQYSTTSLNTIFQMLFAYQSNPSAFGDEYDARGVKGANGIPDIIDEVRWGLDWALKMNPEKNLMFNQIADDRDHIGFRLPSNDPAKYGGKEPQRPVYHVTGEPQVRGKFMNNTTGVSSTAGKFASTFALGAQVMREFDPAYADNLQQKAKEAYEFALTKPGAQQTASVVSPYIYAEDNWADDMELAAIQLDYLGQGGEYLADAMKYAQMEPVTPWMGADTASHYQWYPFVNLGHYYTAQNARGADRDTIISYIKKGLDGIKARGESNPSFPGVPFIWCSNNLTAGAITQARFYEKLTGDKQYAEMEAALRDWLFGCNPWGTSMIVGMPSWGDYPEDPHTSYRENGKKLAATPGGLVDGPVYSSIYNNLLGIRLSKEDVYAPFQTTWCVYHDDFGDYSTNEPTMDGTASLTYYLSSMQELGKKM